MTLALTAINKKIMNNKSLEEKMFNNYKNRKKNKKNKGKRVINTSI